MALDIAEMVVNIFVKGGDKAEKSLKDVGKGVDGIAASSLEAKAAVVALFYSLEQMLAVSGARGNQLTNMAAITGMSVEGIQDVESAFRKLGVTSEEVDSNIKGFQNTLTAIRMGGPRSGQFNQFAQATGLDEKRLGDMRYMLQKANEYSKLFAPEKVHAILGSLGFSENFIAASIRNKNNLETFSGPKFSKGETAELDRVNGKLAEMFNNLKLMSGHFAVKFGSGLIDELDTARRAAERFLGVIDRLSKTVPNFGIYAKVAFGGIILALATLGSGVTATTAAVIGLVAAVAELEKLFEGKSNVFSEAGKYLQDHAGSIAGNAVGAVLGPSAGAVAQTVINNFNIHAPQTINDHGGTGNKAYGPSWDGHVQKAAAKIPKNVAK